MTRPLFRTFSLPRFLFCITKGRCLDVVCRYLLRVSVPVPWICFRMTKCRAQCHVAVETIPDIFSLSQSTFVTKVVRIGSETSFDNRFYYYLSSKHYQLKTLSSENGFSTLIMSKLNELVKIVPTQIPGNARLTASIRSEASL